MTTKIDPLSIPEDRLSAREEIILLLHKWAGSPDATVDVVFALYKYAFQPPRPPEEIDIC